jgi:GPH family glycoside/pentoside/hexuronide:cation symporter
MAFALIFYFSAYSAFNVPYMAMPAEMTDDYHERSRLISFRVVAISIATVIGSALGTYLVGRFGGGVPGHRAMALFIGVVVLISAAVSFVFSAGAPFTTRHETTHLSLGAQWRLVFQNRPFFVLMAVKFCGLINYGFWAVFPYMFTRVLKQPYTVLGTYFAINSLTMIVVQPFWLALGRRYSKKVLLAASSLCFGLIYFTWLWAGPGDPVWTIWVRALALGIVGGGSLLMSQALLPDAIEHDRRQTGLSREGIFAGIYTTVEKAAGAIGSGIAGIFLGAMGYVQSQGGDVEQPHSAIVAIYISTAVFPAVLTCIGVAVLLLFYDLKPTTRAAGIQTA